MASSVPFYRRGEAVEHRKSARNSRAVGHSGRKPWRPRHSVSAERASCRREGRLLRKISIGHGAACFTCPSAAAATRRLHSYLARARSGRGASGVPNGLQRAGLGSIRGAYTAAMLFLLFVNTI
jgi:hypothetical protein